MKGFSSLNQPIKGWAALATSLNGPSEERGAWVAELPILARATAARKLRALVSRAPNKRKDTWAFGLLPGEELSFAPQGRARLTPSSIGLGLDENRLVRSGSSRLADPSVLSAKLESLASPSLGLPSTPTTLLGLGWSTSASLSSYPSYKLARGGLFRRPFTGVSPSPRPFEGLKEAFPLLNLSKASAHLGLPMLTLVSPEMPKFYMSAPSLDAQIGAWSPVWATLTPAPTEDLDPTFINSKWTPEINTTRRSDHNSRYLVSWSPILGSVVTGAQPNPTLSGPSVRAAFSTAALRPSILALNELGLKNSFGLLGIKPSLINLGASSKSGAALQGVAPLSSVSPAPLSPSWVAL